MGTSIPRVRAAYVVTKPSKRSEARQCSGFFFIDAHYTDVLEVVADSDDFGLVSILGVAYQIVESVYLEAVETNMRYEDAYKLAKERVEAYAAVLGKSPIYLLDHQP